MSGTRGSARIAWAAGILVLAAACTSETGDSPAPPDPGDEFASGFEDGDVIGGFEMAAPSVGRFVLRGTLPLAAGIYMPGTSASPFALRAPDGTETNAQVEVVSRYPAEADGADVVELLSTVNAPAGVSPGDRIHYDVIWMPNVPAQHVVSSDVRDLLETPASLILRTTDVFGHPYEADLLHDLREETSELRTYRDGTVAHQIRTHENLEPLAPLLGSTGTLPHMMGVHTYVTTWEQVGFLSIDLRVHNGHEGHVDGDDADDPMGKLYFNELELVTPAGWALYQAYPTPSSGDGYGDGLATAWPLVTPIGGGKLHMMPPQALFHRRLVLCRPGWEARAQAALAEEGLAFCRDETTPEGFRYFSWWNGESSRYWAQNLPLPDLAYIETQEDSRQELSQDFEGLRQALAEGTIGPWPVITGNLGWAHPWGVKVGYMHGGSEIHFSDGIKTTWSASVEGYRFFQMVHRMYNERHRTTLYAIDGDEFHLEDWVYQGPNGLVLPTWIFMIPWLSLGDPHGFGDAPTFQVDAVEALDRQPDYEDYLLQFGHIDAQHLTRYTRSPKVLVWLGNDALAKDDLRMQAELCRATYSALPQTDQGQSITTGLHHDLEHILGTPGDGFSIDRGEGWIIDTVATYYSMADPSWRADALLWFQELIAAIELGQSTCSGTIMARPSLGHFSGQYRMVQSISECILQNGLWGARSSVFVDDADLASVDGILSTSTYAMISPLVWDSEADSPHFYTALGPYDQSLPSFCGSVPADGYEGHDAWQTWYMLLYGMLLTEDPLFTAKATDMAGGDLSPEGLGFDVWPGELETRALMIAYLQNR